MTFLDSKTFQQLTSLSIGQHIDHLIRLLRVVLDIVFIAQAELQEVWQLNRQFDMVLIRAVFTNLIFIDLILNGVLRWLGCRLILWCLKLTLTLNLISVIASR